VARVRITEQAQSELDAILEYYERVGAGDFAEVFEERVIAKIRKLERFPRMGRVVPEIRDDAIREVRYRNHRIVNLVDREEEEIVVLTIFHASRPLGDWGGSEE